MTPEQRLDRIERLARQLCEPDLDDLRQERMQTEKFILLLEMQRKNDGLSSTSPQSDKLIDKLKRQLAACIRKERRLAKRAQLLQAKSDRER